MGDELTMVEFLSFRRILELTKECLYASWICWKGWVVVEG